jgi:hypothetical protein
MIRLDVLLEGVTDKNVPVFRRDIKQREKAWCGITNEGNSL